MLSLEKIPVLGLGINHQKSYEPLIGRSKCLLDFIEFNPDTLCTWKQNEGNASPESHNKKPNSGDDWFLQLSNERFEHFTTQCLNANSNKPAIAHGLSLSIGSASGWNESYLTVLDYIMSHLPLPWHSEHLGFLQIDTPEGETVHAGSQLPMPFFRSAIDLLIPSCLLYTSPSPRD